MYHLYYNNYNRLLEGKIEDLEAGVVRIGRTTIHQQRIGAPGSLSEADLPGSERMGSLVSKKKLAKLTKYVYHSGLTRVHAYGLA